jgi:nucleoside-diphosphate kinase
LTVAVEETLVLVKPDGVARNLTGEILRRIEAKGYSLVDLRMVEPDRELLAAHYAEHEGKPFYEPLVEFMLSGPVVAIRVAGNRVIEGFRSLAGTTDPTTAARTASSPPRVSSRSGSPDTRPSSDDEARPRSPGAGFVDLRGRCQR